MLSRFAILRRDSDGLVLESPLSHVAIELTKPVAAEVVAAFARGASVKRLASRKGAPKEKALVAFAKALLANDFLTLLDDDGATAEDADPRLLTWEYHDLLYHSRSRAGRHREVVGQAMRFEDIYEVAPALKQIEYTEEVELEKPDFNAIQTDSPPFETVMEQRQSIREYGDPPISNKQLGEFLYRSARIVDYGEGSAENERIIEPVQYAHRPYPAGGGLYELETYVAVNRSLDVPAGLYHYDPEKHVLGKCDADRKDIAKLLEDAAAATDTDLKTRQVLVILAARFPRITWTYSAIAYSLILKHVGVVQQTMYLVATAMGLAPCAVESGDSDLFSRAAGVDYLMESSVGEFMLGTRATSPIETLS